MMKLESGPYVYYCNARQGSVLKLGQYIATRTPPDRDGEPSQHMKIKDSDTGEVATADRVFKYDKDQDMMKAHQKSIHLLL